MAPKDARRIPGTLVEVRAMVFMSEAECGRRYGSNKATKVLCGRVLSCEKLSTSSGKTSQTLVTIEIDLGEDKKKIFTTGLRNVKAVMMENLPPNDEGVGSTGSTQFGAPDPQDADGGPQEAPGPKRMEPSSSIPISGTIVTGELADSSNGDGGKNRRSTNTAVMAVEIDAPQKPTVVVHDTSWYKDDAATRLPINGSFAFRNWQATNAMNVHFGEASDTERKYSHLDYFLMMYPPSQITAMIHLTNNQLRVHNKKEITRGELIRFFGSMILATRFQFNNRHDLWSTLPRTRFIGAPRFGDKTGFSRNRFDDIWRHLR
jgi:Transposase IS4